MKEKVKSILVVTMATVGVVWFVYYLGSRAINFMVKLHSG